MKSLIIVVLIILSSCGKYHIAKTKMDREIRKHGITNGKLQEYYQND